jgi:uncharacterized protein with PIN domain
MTHAWDITLAATGEYLGSVCAPSYAEALGRAIAVRRPDMSRACEGTEPLTEMDKQAHREAREIRDELRDLELTVERMKLTALRLRAVALAARKFADRHPATLNQAERELISALKDLDEHDWMST